MERLARLVIVAALSVAGVMCLVAVIVGMLDCPVCRSSEVNGMAWWWWLF